MKERIGSAQRSKNLAEKPYSDMADVDVLRAVGWAAQSNPLGLAVFRWRVSGDQRSVYKVAEGLVEMGYDVQLVCKVLMHMSNDVCTTCFGRGYGTVAGTPILDGEPCKDCRGMGRKELEGDDAQALADVIKHHEREMTFGVIKRLARPL